MAIDYLKLRNALSENQRAMVKRFASWLIDYLPIPWSIEQIAWRFGTDKTHHGYMPYYGRYFAPYRFRNITLLEIGVGTYGPRGGGASLRTWQRYFQRAKIFGMDIIDKKVHEDRRITIIQGDQSDKDFLRKLVREQTGPLDIIIDDGSHVNEHVNASFEALFPLLKVGGIYVIEDMQTSYLRSMGGSPTELDKPGTSMNLAKSLVDHLNSMFIDGREFDYLDRHIEAIHFYRNLVFIEKGDNSNYEVHAYARALMEQGRKSQSVGRQ